MSNELESQIHYVDLEIEQARKFIRRLEAFNRLRDNKDFHEIIEDGYFLQEASRLVLLKGDVNSNEEVQRDCDKLINGVGCLRRYFQTIEILGQSAKNSLDSAEDTKEELLQEQLGSE
jgi:hypothetical protein